MLQGFPADIRQSEPHLVTVVPNHQELVAQDACYPCYLILSTAWMFSTENSVLISGLMSANGTGWLAGTRTGILLLSLPGTSSVFRTEPAAPLVLNPIFWSQLGEGWDFLRKITHFSQKTPMQNGVWETELRAQGYVFGDREYKRAAGCSSRRAQLNVLGSAPPFHRKNTSFCFVFFTSKVATYPESQQSKISLKKIVVVSANNTDHAVRLQDDSVAACGVRNAQRPCPLPVLRVELYPLPNSVACGTPQEPHSACHAKPMPNATRSHKRWMPCGLTPQIWDIADYVQNIFLFCKLLVAPKNQKMPNYTNTWGHQTAMILWE